MLRPCEATRGAFSGRGFTYRVVFPHKGSHLRLVEYDGGGTIFEFPRRAYFGWLGFSPGLGFLHDVSCFAPHFCIRVRTCCFAPAKELAGHFLMDSPHIQSYFCTRVRIFGSWNTLAAEPALNFRGESTTAGWRACGSRYVSEASSNDSGSRNRSSSSPSSSSSSQSTSSSISISSSRSALWC